MKVFCTRCGNPLEIEPSALQAVVTCPACGNQFSPQPGPAGKQAKSGSGTAIVLIIIGVMAVPCLGILAAIAIPNFIRFQARAKQAECKTHLRAMYVAEKAYFSERDEYSPQVAKVGFSPARGNRYAYFLGSEPQMTSRHGSGEIVDPEDEAIDVDAFKFPGQRVVSFEDLPGLAGGNPPGVSGQCPDCEFTGACVGNIDGDDELDVWSVATFERVGAGGQTIPAGQPYNDVNDL